MINYKEVKLNVSSNLHQLIIKYLFVSVSYRNAHLNLNLLFLNAFQSAIKIFLQKYIIAIVHRSHIENLRKYIDEPFLW